MELAEMEELLDSYGRLARNVAERKQAALGLLLEEVAPVYAQIRATRRTTARRFNVFEALGIERRELSHSAFLAYLLDPRAHHDQGARMLRSFLRRLAIDVPASVDLDRTVVSCEHPLEQHGRLDIALFLPNGSIVCIENKVDAEERDGQVSDYQHWLARQRWSSGRHVLVFLTPEGRQPQSSVPSIDLKCWSYSDVADWLREHDDLPNRLRTVVGMYIEICEWIGRPR